jgi:hypothetical protein
MLSPSSCSDVLQRVKDFLPNLIEANKAVEEEICSKNGRDYNIESLEEGERHIQMVSSLAKSTDPLVHAVYLPSVLSVLKGTFLPVTETVLVVVVHTA